MNSFNIKPEYTRQTRYEHASLAREIILRAMEPRASFHPPEGFQVKWLDDNSDNIYLFSHTVDGPYRLTRNSLVKAASDHFIFSSDSNNLKVELNSETDLFALNLAQLPHEAERLMLRYTNRFDALPRGSRKWVEAEEIEEIGALLAAQHILGDRMRFPEGSIELHYESPVEDEAVDFDRQKVAQLLALLTSVQPTKKAVVFEKLYEISNETLFASDQETYFVLQLNYLLRMSAPYVKALHTKPDDQQM